MERRPNSSCLDPEIQPLSRYPGIPPDPHDGQPPRLADRLLDAFCRFELAEEIRGDLVEAWEVDRTEKGRFRANLTYWLEVILFIRSHVIRRRDPSHARGSVMWKNYLTIAVRSVRKQKTYSAINFLGLAVGLACTFLIAAFVSDELSYDTYHDDADRIVRMTTSPSDEYDGIAKVNGAWGAEAVRRFPQIESMARFMFFGTARFAVDERAEDVSGGFLADSTTFDVFSWNVISGNPETALDEPYSLVLTESLAESWFGSSDARGEQILVDGEDIYTVTAIMEDVPSNSHFRFSFLASMSSYQDERHDDWVIWNQYYTYLKLQPGTDVAELEEATFDMLGDYLNEDQLSGASAIIYQPLGDIYLRSNMFREIGTMGNARAVQVFMILGIFILLIAGVNFVNLSTARSALRAREVGVRKSLGARRGVLIRQFLSESTLTVFFSALLAVGLIAWYLEPFNMIAGKSFTLAGLFTTDTILVCIAVLLGTGLVAGVYPALVLSGFSPVRIFSGFTGGRGSATFRRVLVTTQFVVSAALIMGTGVVADQIRFIENRALGFEQENVVSIPFRDRDLVPQFDAIRDEMALVPGVQEIALSANRPGGSDYGIPIEIPGLTREETPGARLLVADYDFLDVFGMQLAQGRDFDRDRPADHETGALINEKLARQLGWEDPIGKIINMPGVGRRFEVIGVLKDFHFRSLHEPIFPLMLFMAPDEWYSQVVVRLDPSSTQTTLDRLAGIYEKYDAVNPFAFSFMDQTLDNLYAADQRARDLLMRFTLLAIIIACLGLFGLSAYTAQRRRAEIGVRKVIGASERSVVWLLSKETALLVGIAIVLALPAVWYFGSGWLESFAYASGIRPMTLVLGALTVFALAFITTGTQALRAARLNPVKAIRSD